jgi:hypothetical protein
LEEYITLVPAAEKFIKKHAEIRQNRLVVQGTENRCPD